MNADCLLSWSPSRIQQEYQHIDIRYKTAVYVSQVMTPVSLQSVSACECVCYVLLVMEWFECASMIVCDAGGGDDSLWWPAVGVCVRLE